MTSPTAYPAALHRRGASHNPLAIAAFHPPPLHGSIAFDVLTDLDASYFAIAAPSSISEWPRFPCGGRFAIRASPDLGAANLSAGFGWS